MTLLDVKHVQKIYKTRFQGNQVEALKDIHFTVEKGDYVAIMGESGSGKSTLLNILAMLDKPTRGQVYLNGTDTATIKNSQASSFRREKLGFVFQDFNLLDTLSVKDNILLPLVLSRRPITEMMKKLVVTAENLGINQLQEKYPYEISGGQKQRVGIARALATKPALLLADEATSALDPETTQEVLALLKKVNQELGITVIVITHEMDVVASIANRVAVMENGRVVEEGTVYDVFSSPQTDVAKLFVATTVKQVPTGEDAAELRKNHKGYLVNVEIIEGNQKLGKVLSYLSERRVRFNIVQGGIETLQGKAYGTLTLELLGEVTSIDAVVAELKTVTRVKEVR